MIMKKLAIASAVALMSMGAAYAQQTTVTTTTQQADAAGLMTTLSNSVGNLFAAGRTNSITETIDGTPGSAATYRPYVARTGTNESNYSYPDASRNRYSFNEVTGVYTPSDTGSYVVDRAAVAAIPGLVKVTGSNPIDITALGGAVNLAAINGGINITGVNVNLSGVTGALTGLSTTVIGAMNSSTLDVAKSVTTLSDKTASTLNIAGLANQGPGPTITSQSFGPGQLKLGTMGSDILKSADGTSDGAGTTSKQFNMTGLTSSTDTLASSMTDKLQNMNVFNMAVNMAPLVAGVNIAALSNPNAWFLNPDNGSVKLSGLQVATTTIGAMNSSITRLGANLAK